MNRTPLLLALAATLAATPASAAPTGVTVSGWARPTVAGQSSGAAYLVIRNYGPGADRLVAVASPAASMAGVHRSQLTGGVSRMRPAGPIEIAPGKMLTMAPNGYHVMLMGLKAPLKPGAKLPLTVTFAKAGRRTLQLPIQMSAPQ
ncbi:MULTISPECIES: copper chaperone PCu(A)C [Sphingomonas]|uniref:copper chaperone PCu(A)C n=1 Tax=Sphingomonas TaxID=13687 RepID=UPI0013B3A3B4|nr:MULTISPECIES: copper chaperone PCu(A)C [Sphingomonas]